MRYGMLFFVLMVAAVAGPGCSPPAQDSIEDAVDVRGTLTQGGQPLEVAGRDIGTGMVQISFIPVGLPPEQQQPFATTVDEQGKFDLPGGIPAGEYRVVVRQWEPYPQTDKLGGKYDERNSTQTVTVTGKDPIVIDLP